MPMPVQMRRNCVRKRTYTKGAQRMNRIIVLNGSALTTEEVTAVARGGVRVEIDDLAA